MNRRVHLKDLALVICFFIGSYYVYFHQPCVQSSPEPPLHQKQETEIIVSSTELSCYLNRESSRNTGQHAAQKIDCHIQEDEVFLPFTFFKNYFELSGSFVSSADDKEFEISQSYSRVNNPTGPYNPFGEFMHFISFDVEGRSRVLCVSALDGVPVSTQWDPKGYYYPTQIAQFALSHYSTWSNSNFKDEKPSRLRIELVGSGERVKDEETDSFVTQFSNKAEYAVGEEGSVLSLALKAEKGSETEVRVELKLEDPAFKSPQLYTLRYSQTTAFILGTKDEFEFGFGHAATGVWHKLTRDLYTDLKKGFAFTNQRKGFRLLRKGRLHVLKISFHGAGRVTNVTLSNSEDLEMFLAGANWFVKNQDGDGGWPSDVVFNPKKKKYPKADEIPPGWYGAMCQGQAISVLCRAYHVTGEARFLKAATAALAPFTRDSKTEGGVRASFMNRLDWYEEYPTNPSTFILNGFMYSLIGLFDLWKTNPANSTAEKLYQRGMESLVELLPLYDSGSGTFYDLRHFTMKTTPKIARWDYHSTHINQLLLLSSIQNDSSLKITAERWRGYMVGKRAPHN